MEEGLTQPIIPTIKIEIDRGKKGEYGWTVRVYADSVEEAMQQVKEADLTLRREYGFSA